MWIALIIVPSVMVGACIGFVALAIMTASKGSLEDQRLEDEAQIRFIREWRAAPPLQWEFTHDPRGHHWTAVRHRVLSLQD